MSFILLIMLIWSCGALARTMILPVLLLLILSLFVPVLMLRKQVSNTKFFSRCNRPTTVAVPIGGTFAPVYEERIVDGVQRLVVVGETNLFDYVQSSKEDCLVYNILDRFYRGDLTALTSKVGQFIDVTGMPSTLAEAQQMLINANEKFSHLPDDIKAKFDGDVNKYISKIANASIDELKSYFGVGDPAAPVEEVESDVA